MGRFRPRPTRPAGVLADLWSGDIVSQHTFHAELDDPTAFTRVQAGGPTACVWELAVHAHESDAYIRHVLDPPGGAAIGAYLSDTLDSGAADHVGPARARPAPGGQDRC